MRILIGEKLRKLREEIGITQTELAKHLKCSPKIISNYELNKREPDLLMIKKLCDYFNISADYIIGRSLYRNVSESTDVMTDELLKYFNALPSKYKNDILRYAQLSMLDFKINSQR